MQGLVGPLVFGIVFVISSVFIIASGSVDGLKALNHPRKGSAKPYVNNITNLCSDMSFTCTTTLSNSAIKASSVPVCLNCANSQKEIFGSFLSNLSINV
jgi:hypothetical protein